MASHEEREYMIEYMSRIWLGSAGNDRDEIVSNLNAPPVNPSTGQPFKSFREILGVLPEGAVEEFIEQAIARGAKHDTRRTR